MKRVFLSILVLVISFSAISQPKKNFLYTGVEFAMPAHQPFQSNKANGYMANIKGEHFFSPSFSASVSAGLSYFKGKLVFWDGSTDNSFSLVPILIGGRFYYRKIYVGVETGPAIAASKRMSTNIAIAPSAGVIVDKFDIGIKFFAVPARGGIPELTFLQKGGYSYIGLRVAFRLNN
jgi:hypothetical protein